MIIKTLIRKIKFRKKDKEEMLDKWICPKCYNNLKPELSDIWGFYWLYCPNCNFKEKGEKNEI